MAGTKDLGKVGLTTGFENSEQDRLDHIIMVSGNPNGSVTALKGTIGIDEDGPSIWQNTDGATAWSQLDVAGSGVLGTPTDGDLGNDGDPLIHHLTGVEVGDSLTDAIDKTLDYLTVTAPDAPTLITAIDLVIEDSYEALEQNTGTTKTEVTAVTSPIALTDDLFGDSSSGTVNAYVSGGVVGTRVLTSGAGGDDGTYTNLILANEELYNQVYERIDASFTPLSALTPSNTAVPFKLEHNFVNTEKDVYIDNPVAPVVVFTSATASHATTANYISGVPSLKVGDSLIVTFDVQNAVSYFYNSTRIARVESDYGVDADVPLPGTPPVTSATVTTSLYAIAALDNVYSEGVDFTLIGYNSRAGSTAEIATDDTELITPASSIRIDTDSDESIRVKSGAGQYPTAVVGDAYDSTENLNANEELQLLDEYFQFPTGDYTLNVPTVGPNYSAIAGGTYSNMRWVTFDLGAVVNEKHVTLNMIDLVNFGTDVIVSNFAFYVKIEGDTDWVDGNAAYIGYGDPTADGDAALDISNSIVSIRQITFGTIPQTGNLLVRVGIPLGDSKKFKQVVLA